MEEEKPEVEGEPTETDQEDENVSSNLETVGEEQDEEAEEESEEETEYEPELLINEEEKDKYEDFWDEMDEGEWPEGETEGMPEAELGETVEEEVEAEEGPPDPSAPYNLSDSSEALKAPFQLRPDQLEEVTELWALFLDYTPAYTDLDGYVTEKELVYMLKSLNLQTFTPEQLMELIVFCVRPPHPDNHVNFEQFVHMVTIRQRDMPQEEEIRLALQNYDPANTGIIDREYLRENLATTGHKMKNVDNFIKEVDMANDGTLPIEDVVGTMCIDLNRDDIDMLYAQINPPEEQNPNLENLTT